MTPGPLDVVVAERMAAHGSPIAYRPSPNYNQRATPGLIDALIVHYTALDLEETLDHLCREENEVSTHFVIDRDGALFQLLPLAVRGWHAGVGELAGRGDVNGRSVGLDLVHIPGKDRGFTDAQYRVLAVLTRVLVEVLPIDHSLIVGHEHVARPMGRKSDPGPEFDWVRYFEESSVEGPLELVLSRG